ncbi:MAG: hypothetical protein HY509_02895 [Acidobacteria bacterium]|nr:hypothetical protein [Acidobacteriota bacterium]
MSEEYRIPKHKVAVTVGFPGKPDVQMYVFLGETAQTHAGTERPSDLLNGREPFFPVVDYDGGIHFVHRDALSVLTAPADREFREDLFGEEDRAPAEATNLAVEVELEDGRSLEGRVCYLMPRGQRRLQDVLNLETRFLVLRAGTRALLINKRRIEKISPKAEDGEGGRGQD